MRGVLWCNGSIPTESVVEWVLTTGAPVFGVDGGSDKAHSCGIEVVEVLGDMDSLDESAWKGRTLPLNEQTFSDLAKSIRELIHRGFDEIEIVGADGGDPSHILGNWAAMNDAPSGARIRIHHEEQVSTRLHPDDEGFSAEFEEGELFSIFAIEAGKVWISGAKWELHGDDLGLSSRGLHNEGIGDVVNIRGEGVLILVSKR
ncbi:MAG: thiamine diphosphokinase [Candidatus Thalassarchaeum sp.]|jgi:thiamine pyrophosphokinase|nr:thiamine diphosphokinase [Candidatus Thalassarchaeum sp.]|tara:strand:- start:2420 stop:3025 length:606 start_codon:yes stop_codon:yes gene_type:complete